MIRVNDLSKSFDGRQVLNCPEIQFEEGEVHGIIGLNGAGKTTFFNIVSGYLKPDKGKITRDGALLKRNEIIFFETVNFFYTNITGNEYLELFPSSNLHFQLDKINQLLHLPLNSIIDTYSSGMKKKLALLAILKQDKTVYIFDEPFNGLDLETNKILEITIHNLKSKGKTIFISSHILSPLINVCEKIHLLQLGSFKKSYNKDQFETVESELFMDFNEKATAILNNSL